VEVEPEMKTQRLAAMLAVATGSLCAGQSAVTQKATVIVCMENDPSIYVLTGVRTLASGRFASIGIGIDWREADSCPVRVGAIQVHLSHDSTKFRDLGTEALAFARPYTRTIVVFVDRVKEASRSLGVSVMPSVLVHEITHILEGIDRHSATGVMKAQWNYKDYSAMYREALAFAQEDIDLIYAGLKIPRATEAAVAAQ
jgi:hypothetical protein